MHLISMMPVLQEQNITGYKNEMAYVNATKFQGLHQCLGRHLGTPAHFQSKYLWRLSAVRSCHHDNMHVFMLSTTSSLAPTTILASLAAHAIAGTARATNWNTKKMHATSLMPMQAALQCRCNSDVHSSMQDRDKARLQEQSGNV